MAIWSSTEQIPLFDNGSGNWGFMTSICATTPGTKVIQTVNGVTIENFMKEFNIGRIDLLKVDVEGAEKEIFESADTWIEKVGAIYVELHEEMVPGVTQLVSTAIADFDVRMKKNRTLFAAKSSVNENY